MEDFCWISVLGASLILLQLKIITEVTLMNNMSGGRAWGLLWKGELSKTTPLHPQKSFMWSNPIFKVVTEKNPS